MKFIADVNVSRRVVERLREAGFEVTRVTDFMDARSPDDEIILAARRLGAIVISHDQDFTNQLAVSGAATPSLVNVRVSYVDRDRIARSIAETIRAALEDLEAGAIVTLDDHAVRIHRLPIS